MQKKISRLNARIPSEELTAFRTWCASHEMTMSRVLTGLIHTFNVRQQKMDEAETEKLRAKIEANAHEAAQAFKQQGQQLLREAAGQSEALPMPDMR